MNTLEQTAPPVAIVQELHEDTPNLGERAVLDFRVRVRPAPLPSEPLRCEVAIAISSDGTALFMEDPRTEQLRVTLLAAVAEFFGVPQPS